VLRFRILYAKYLKKGNKAEDILLKQSPDWESEEKTRHTLSADLGPPDDKPARALFESVDGG
jgi:hypothetical protein